MKSMLQPGKIVILAAVLAAASAPAPAGWYNDAWTCRRAVLVGHYVPNPAMGGDEVAVVTMPTGGLMENDGADVRVTDSEGRELPSRVLMVGPGDQVRVVGEPGVGAPETASSRGVPGKPPG